jgi:hypothetical protein
VSSTPRTVADSLTYAAATDARPPSGGIPLESGRVHRDLTEHLVRPLNGGTTAINQDKLTEFLHKFAGDLGATMAAGNVLVDDRDGR